MNRVYQQYGNGALKTMGVRGKLIAGRLTHETFARQVEHWVGTYWDAACGLANADRGGGVISMMKRYQGEIDKLSAGLTTLDGVGLTGFKLDAGEARALRRELTPGISGDAATDFERMLKSDWAKEHISQPSRAKMLEQVRAYANDTKSKE